MTQAILRIDQLAKHYGSIKALGGVSAQIERGSFVALLGPNGAGKSTLFQLLTGLFSADAGSIEICGFDLRRQPTRALARIGVVFQQPTLDLDLSARGNLRFHARLHGLDRSRERIDAALIEAGLDPASDEACRQLSGGNRRKVELARALLHEPELLLMDEATVGLDPASRRLLLDSVRRRCRERGLSVLWATHLIDEAEVADRVLILHKGQLLADDRPQAIAEAYDGSLTDALLTMTGQSGGRQQHGA